MYLWSYRVQWRALVNTDTIAGELLGNCSARSVLHGHQRCDRGWICIAMRTVTLFLTPSQSHTSP